MIVDMNVTDFFSLLGDDTYLFFYKAIYD